MCSLFYLFQASFISEIPCQLAHLHFIPLSGFSSFHTLSTFGLQSKSQKVIWRRTQPQLLGEPRSKFDFQNQKDHTKRINLRGGRGKVRESRFEKENFFLTNWGWPVIPLVFGIYIKLFMPRIVLNRYISKGTKFKIWEIYFSCFIVD